MKKDKKQLNLFGQESDNTNKTTLEHNDIDCGQMPPIPNMLDLLGGGLNMIGESKPITENRYEKIRDMLSKFDTDVSAHIDSYLETGKLTRSNFLDLRSLLMDYMGTDDECIKFLEAYLEDIRREASTVFPSNKNTLAINMLVDVLLTRVDALIPKYKAHLSKSKRANGRNK